MRIALDRHFASLITVNLVVGVQKCLMPFPLTYEILYALHTVDFLATLRQKHQAHSIILFSNIWSQLICYATSFDRIGMLCVMTSHDIAPVDQTLLRYRNDS